MMPIKQILETRHLTPKPPVLVINETRIKSAVDAGPVCGCDEKYDLIKNYKPFILGGANPYSKTKRSEGEHFQIQWRQLKLGSCDLIFEKPIAISEDELPDNVISTKATEDVMFVKQPVYTEDYMMEKWKECEREHSEGCNCTGK